MKYMKEKETDLKINLVVAMVTCGPFTSLNKTYLKGVVVINSACCKLSYYFQVMGLLQAQFN